MIRGQERTHQKGDLLNFSEFWLIFSYKTVSKINLWAVGDYVDENTDRYITEHYKIKYYTDNSFNF